MTSNILVSYYIYMNIHLQSEQELMQFVDLQDKYNLLVW